MVVLDVDVTPELEPEGQARDLIRLVQQARRDADLAVTDRIAPRASRADDDWVDAVRAHEDADRRRDAGDVDRPSTAPATDSPTITVARG